ncbi:MAG: ABC transporter permease subunit [Pseudomonadota bacterium]|jgi:oligopeptide transport system permease protein
MRNSLWRLLLGRLLFGVPTLWVVITVAFLLVRLAPGGPFDAEQRLPPAVKANLDRTFGLDRPLVEQYQRYLGRVLHGDLGPSLRLRDRRVIDLVREGLPVSLTLGGLALVLALLVGISGGLLAAVRRGRAADRVLAGVSVLAVALPPYVTAPLLVWIFAVYLGWLPVAGWTAGRWLDLVLPVVALALPTAGSLLRIVRASALDVLASPAIQAARARGLSATRILWAHVLPPTLSPVLASLGGAAAGLLGGSLVIESVFGLPGMGRFLVEGALNRDYTLVLGKVLVYAVLVLVLNLGADLGALLLDPRLDRRGAPR